MFRVVFGVLLAAMAYGWGWVDSGWADKLVQPLVFDGSATTVALSIYESTADNQADVVKALLKTSRSFYKPVGGFERFALLTSTDGSRIATLTQWQDAASYDAFQASLATAEDDEDYTKYYEKFVKERPGSSGLILDPPEPLLSAAFTVDQTAAPPGMMPITIGENALVQMIDVAGRSPEDQGLMLDAARRSLDALPSLYPPPRSALVLQAIDAPYVALLANWGYATEFNDVSQLPLIALTMPSLEVAAAAEGEVDEAISQDASQATEPSPQPVLSNLENLSLDDHLYQLAKVVAPKVSKYGAS
jgi:heme-degrading monooxygenase HmoA